MSDRCERLWKSVVRNNPALEAGRVTVKASQIRRMFFIAYEKGLEDSSGPELGDMAGGASDQPWPEVFDKFFSPGKRGN